MNDVARQRVIKETEFMYHHSNWMSSSTNIKTSVTEMESIVAGIQVCCYQDCLFQYLSESNAPMDFDVINRIRRNPLSFSDRKAEVQFECLNIASNIQRWTAKFFTDIEKFVDVLHAYFTKNHKELGYFASVTFPNICFHFVTREFDEIGAKICTRVIDKSVEFWPFCVAYLRRLPSFEEALWKEFDVLSMGRESTWELFDPFVKALQKVLPLLSYNQHELLVKLGKEKKDVFCKCFLGMIRRSYMAWHGDKHWSPGHDAFLELLNFLEDPSTPHVEMIIAEIQGCNRWRTVLDHGMLRNIVKTPVILCPHDCLLMQKILESDEVYAKSVIQSIRFSEQCAGNFEPRNTTIALTYLKSISDKDPIHLFDRIEPANVEKNQELQRKFLSFQQAIGLPMREFYRFLYSDERHQVAALISLEAKRLNALKQNQEFRFYANCQFHEAYLKQFGLLEEHMSRLYYRSFLEDFLQDTKKQLTATLKGVLTKLEHVDKHRQARSPMPSDQARRYNVVHAVVSVRNCFNVIDEVTRAGKVLKASSFSSSGTMPHERKKSGSRAAMIMTGGAFYDVARLLGAEGPTKADGSVRRVGRRFSVEGTVASSSNFKRLALNGLQKLAQPDSKVIFLMKLFDEFPANDPQVQVLASQYIAALSVNRQKVIADSLACDARIHNFQLLAEQCQLFETRKRGSNMLELIDVSKCINHLANVCKDDHGKRVPYFMCLTRFMLLCDSSSALFQAYLWVSKVLFAFADFKGWLSPGDQQSINAFVSNMKLSIQYLSDDLMEDVNQCSSRIFS